MALAHVPLVPESWMLSRVNRETRVHHQLADNDRLALLSAGADRVKYVGMLSRIFGFEAPVEAAVTMAPGLDQLLDVRDRSSLRLLRADLQALGVFDASQLPRCTSVAPLRDAADALGWMYVVERNTLMHGMIERHLRGRMPEVLKTAGSYLAGQQRSNGQRLRDLGTAMDRMAKDPACAARIVSAAKTAFRIQHGWYDAALRPRVRVA